MIEEKRLLRSYADAMLKASEIIRVEDPDFLIVPMLGSVPFIDAMAIVDRDFDSSKAVYMPASSRIKDVNGVIRSWYTHFLDENVNFPDYLPKILGIDEVVSGSSVMRCLKHIDVATGSKRKRIRQDLVKSLHSSEPKPSLEVMDQVDSFTDNRHALEFAKIRERILKHYYRKHLDSAREDSHFFVEVVRNSLENHLKYRSIGVEDSKFKNKRNLNYEDAKAEGRILPVEVESIITMDMPQLVPPRFEVSQMSTGRRNNYVQFSPVVVDFKVTPAYINFLRDLASYTGKNPDEVSPVNMSKILHSSDYLSRRQKE